MFFPEVKQMTTIPIAAEIHTNRVNAKQLMSKYTRNKRIHFLIMIIIQSMKTSERKTYQNLEFELLSFGV
jgi:hypothetical protein